MKMLIIAAVLQVTAPATVQEAPAAAPAAPAAAPSVNQMSCVYDRQTRSRLCTAANGDQYRCRRERVSGSRMPTTLCTTAAQDAQMERDSRHALDRSQRMGTTEGN
jgi:hypothetical protein